MINSSIIVIMMSINMNNMDINLDINMDIIDINFTSTRVKYHT